MANILIRDIQPELVLALDAKANLLGLSRVEYLRRAITRDVLTSSESVTEQHLRSLTDLQTAFKSLPLTKMPIEGVTPAIEELAWRTLHLLAKRGQRIAPSIPDLLVAATAQLCELTVLHRDKDFELISKVTNQRVEKLIINS